MKVTITNARLAFPSLFEAKLQMNGTDEKFDGNFIIPKTDKVQAKKIKDAMIAAAIEKFGENGAKMLDGFEKNRKCFRDGDLNLNASGEIYNGYEGGLYLVAKSAKRPLVIDRDKTPLTAADGRPYAGCYVNVSFEIYAVKGKESGGNGVFAELKGVQFVKDGESFGGGTPASPDDFEDLGVDGEEEDSLV